MKGFRCHVVKPTPGEREVTQDSRAAEERRLPRLTWPPFFVGRVLGADVGPWSSISCGNSCFWWTCNDLLQLISQRAECLSWAAMVEARIIHTGEYNTVAIFMCGTC